MSRMACLMTVLVAFAVAAESGAENAQEMIATADKVRNPGRPFRVTNTLVEYVDGREVNRSTVTVYAKEDESTKQYSNVVQYVSPSRDRGKIVLLAAAKMWFYDPASKVSIRLSPQQRLIGQASNGDVVTANLSTDYSATILREEELHDAERVRRDCWLLELVAKNQNAIYSRIEYWLEKSTYSAVKGKYYSASGRLLKIAYFRNYEQRLDSLQPLQTIIIDAVDQKLVTTMTVSDFRFQDIPDSWFQRDFLPRFPRD